MIDKDRILNFIQLILLSSNIQRKIILKNITKKQCATLRAIIYNVMFNKDIVLKPQDKTYLTRHISDIKYLASKKICLSEKKDIIYKKYLLIKRVIQIANRYLT